MNNSNQITNLMMTHHGLIMSLLSFLKDTLNLPPEKYPEVVNSFEKFKWELEKHIFAEERVIFKAWSKEDSEISKIIQDLIKNHSKMLEALDTICDNLAPNYQFSLDKFETLLKEHASIEETVLYPKLDKVLGDKEKTNIIKKIDEIPLRKTVR